MLHGSARALCALVLILSLQVSAAGAKKPAPKKELSTEISTALSGPLNRAHWGIDVVDLETGKALFSQNSDHLFLPA
ncbi:MAG: hypothetical protein ACXVK3_13950 [Candidatus Angelobacter sp.]